MSQPIALPVLSEHPVCADHHGPRDWAPALRELQDPAAIAGQEYPCMSMSSLKLLKYVLFFFNLLFWFCGCCILGFGIYLLVHNNFRVLPSLTLGNVLVIVGSIIMVLAFLGCMGSIKENKCLLMSFFVLLLIILLAEVTLAILLFVYEQKTAHALIVLFPPLGKPEPWKDKRPLCTNLPSMPSHPQHFFLHINSLSSLP
ncbi:leukocyte surface antigen CD53 isoform X2 [Manis javanica]|uniref:leukocyte surface antigen CD53 isoform X2 n=1 Tax=Manis javanica TaxID=9974 RepID=UPI003C6D8163